MIALTPILAPSLLAAISFIQWFGNQGAAEGAAEAARSVYGPIGIILSPVYATFPHALMIVLTALLLADGRLYEAADRSARRRGASSSRSRCRGAKYGLVSAAMVVFSYTVSDFGIPKVIGGNFNVLADRHLQAGDRPAGLQQGRGRRPHAAAAGAARVRRRLGACSRQPAGAVLGARRAVRAAAVARGSTRDARLLRARRALICSAVLGMAVYTSFIKLWPYDQSFSLRHYVYGLDRRRASSTAFFNSLQAGAADGVLRHGVHLLGAYLLEKTRGMRAADGGRAAARGDADGGARAWCWASATSSSSTSRDNPLNVLYQHDGDPRARRRSSTTTRRAT